MRLSHPHVIATIAFTIFGLGSLSALADDPNALTPEERSAGFKRLFNGTDLDGWEHAGNWTVEDGALHCAAKGGNLTCSVAKVPDDFELRFEWKVGEGSNSGVYYRPGQYEYQVLDNQVHKDGKNPRTSAASLYFCMAPCCDATKPVGQWNSGRIVCQGTVIQHWLNGKKVVDFNYADPKWAWNVDMLNKRGAELTDRDGSLYLQDHGDPVWFRAIKGRALPASEQLDRTPITPAVIPDEVLEAERTKLQGIVDRREKQAAAAKKK